MRGPRAPFNNSAPLEWVDAWGLWGGGVPRHPPTPLDPPPPAHTSLERFGQVLFRAFGQSKIFFGAFDACKNAAPQGVR